MKARSNKIILLVLLAISMISCSEKILKEDAIYDPKDPQLEEVKKQAETILAESSRIFMQANYLVELYTKDSTEKSPKLVLDFENISPKLEASYNIIRYKSGEIMYVAEFPYAADDNWENIYESVFDQKGNLLKFIRKSSFYFKKKIVREKSEYYYWKNKLLKKTYEIKDGNGKAIEDYNSIQFGYRFPYKQYYSRKDWLKAHGMEK